MIPEDNLAGLTIRDLTDLAEMREVEQLQKDVWGVADREIFPARALVPLIELGGILLGAFAGQRMAGFVFGFPGLEKGRVIIHSDMLAVRPEYRLSGLGYKLKLAQRERALANGIDTITWTFDPLQSVNAHLNFGKLGVVADSYRVDYYGETTSFLHQAGTDRLWVTCQIDSQRVRRRIEVGQQETLFAAYPLILRMGANGEPIESTDAIDHEVVLVEIPTEINALRAEQPQLALSWRAATRRVFTQAIDNGYRIEEFCKSHGASEPAGKYLLFRS